MKRIIIVLVGALLLIAIGLYASKGDTQAVGQNQPSPVHNIR